MKQKCFSYKELQKQINKYYTIEELNNLLDYNFDFICLNNIIHNMDDENQILFIKIEGNYNYINERIKIDENNNIEFTQKIIYEIFRKTIEKLDDEEYNMNDDELINYIENLSRFENIVKLYNYIFNFTRNSNDLYNSIDYINASDKINFYIDDIKCDKIINYNKYKDLDINITYYFSLSLFDEDLYFNVNEIKLTIKNDYINKNIINDYNNLKENYDKLKDDYNKLKEENEKLKKKDNSKKIMN